jgi:hypothetical protein
LRQFRCFAERPLDGITTAKLVGIEVSPEFASTFSGGRQRVRFNRVTQLDRLSPERRQSRTAAAVARSGFDHDKAKKLFRSLISSRARRS